MEKTKKDHWEIIYNVLLLICTIGMMTTLAIMFNSESTKKELSTVTTWKKSKQYYIQEEKFRFEVWEATKELYLMDMEG